MDEPLWMWGVFLTLISLLLVFDLGFNKNSTSFKKNLLTTLFYIGVALLFGVWIGYTLGLQSFTEYMTGFLVEKSLSLDNIFVISLIFSGLSIPIQYQRRVLFWGILGVIFLRALMIGLGIQLIQEAAWVLYIFGLFLILTGIKILFSSEKSVSIEENAILSWMNRHLRITKTLHDEKFFVKIEDAKKEKKWFMTPLFAALVLVECTDLIFAIDSIPAIFSITLDPYIVYTSNIFAILGLRSLYTTLSIWVGRFEYFKFFLAILLIFIGSKIFIVKWLDVELPTWILLGVTLLILASGMLYSLVATKRT